MKRILLLAAIIGIFSHFTKAQSYVDYENDNRAFFGINLGTTWHCQTEVDNQYKPGISFHFGQSFFMQPNNIFSLDYRLKFAFKRYQGQSSEKFLIDSNHAQVYPDYFFGLDNYEKNLGYFIPNFRTDLFSAALELVLNTNRLRQNTGINLYLFGGIDLSSYNVLADITGNGFSYYDYNQLNSYKKADILEFQNGDYSEELFQQSTTLIPSLGFGISYQFSRTFALSFEHKTLFPGHNKFDGLDKKYSSTQFTTQNDIIHFTSIGVKFHILRSHINYEDDSPYDYRYKPDNNPLPDTRQNTDPIPDTNTDPITNEVIDNPQPPIVNFIHPNSSPHSTNDYIFPLEAEIKYVSDRNNIVFKVNGEILSNFAFNPQINDFKSSIVLKDGSNLVEIKAVNPYGEDYESVIIYIKEENPINPPIVNITNPANSPAVVDYLNYSFKAEVLNIDDKSQINFLYNNANHTNYIYDNINKQISANLKLNEGSNEVIITAKNQDGSESESAIIIYQKKQNIMPPAVQIAYPSDNFVSKSKNIQITANTVNIFNENDISLFLNNLKLKSFDFNRNDQSVSLLVSLNEGINVFRVEVQNQFGKADDQIKIIYKKTEIKIPPQVSFVERAKMIRVKNESYNVLAKTVNISNSDKIILKQNGNTIPNSDYFIGKDFSIRYKSKLKPGNNVFEIFVQNKDGADSDKLTVVYEAPTPCDMPIITALSKTNINTIEESVKLKCSTKFINDKTQINVVLNGKLIPFNFNKDLIEIENYRLGLGQNIVQINAQNDCGNDNVSFNIIREKCEKLTINSITPANNFTSKAEKILISGNIKNIDASSKLQIKHNNSNAVNLPVNANTNNFKTEVQLKAGLNTFTIIAINDCGENQYELKIYYNKETPCDPPILGEISKNNYSTNKNRAIVKVSAKNISNKSEISVSHNGNNSLFEFVNNTIEVNNIKLSEGDNTINITAQNDCGKDELTYRIKFEKCNAPKILELSNENDFSTEKDIEKISGKTIFAEKSDIQILVNKTHTGFNYNSQTEIFNADLNLKIGKNLIQIIVSNNCGVDKKSFIITRNKPCEALNYNLVSPNNLQSSTDNKTTDFTLKTYNIYSRHNINIKLNGVITPFNFANGEINISNIQLKEGNNKIEVDLKNECSSKNLNYNINYKPCVPPEINYSGALSSNTKIFNFVAKITNVNSQNDISLFVNNKSETFTYNKNTNDFSSKITLNNGNNTVRIIAKGCKSASETFTIKFSDKPCKAITYELSSPANLDLTINTNKFDFAIAVFEVENISLKLNGKNINYNHSNNFLTANNLDLKTGLNIIKLDISNDCSNKSFTFNITVASPKPEPKGPYFELDKDKNSFCMQTAKEVITDDFLRKNPNYKFSGVVNSLYFKAADGGGKARVNKKQIIIVPGTYYHFTTNVRVSMTPKKEKGKVYWEIVILSNTAPKSGFGAKQPPNPCTNEIKKRDSESDNMRRR